MSKMHYVSVDKISFALHKQFGNLLCTPGMQVQKLSWQPWEGYSSSSSSSSSSSGSRSIFHFSIDLIVHLFPVRNVPHPSFFGPFGPLLSAQMLIAIQ
jgi:hypothetical protein